MNQNNQQPGSADLTKAEIDAIVYECRQSGADTTYDIVKAAIAASRRAAGGEPDAWMVGMDVFKHRAEAERNVRNPDLVPVPLYRAAPSLPDVAMPEKITFDNWYTGITVEGSMYHNMRRAWDAALASQHDADFDALLRAIMNFPARLKDSDFATATDRLNYKTGHRDARHDACDLVAEFASGFREGRNTSSESVGEFIAAEGATQAGDALDARRWRFYDENAMSQLGLKRFADWIAFDGVMEHGSRNAAIDYVMDRMDSSRIDGDKQGAQGVGNE